MQTLSAAKLFLRIVFWALVLVVVMCLCCLFGPEHVSLSRAFASGSPADGINIDYEILVRIRLPRVCLACVIGAALACCGAVFQALLRNPLADPYILGISSGAGLGAIIATISGVSWSLWWGSPMAVFAFVGAIATVWLVWLIGTAAGGGSVTSLLLAGVVINAFFSAIIMFLISVARSSQLQTTIFWLMGNLNAAALQHDGILPLAGCITVAGIAVLYFMAPQLNAVSFDPDDARTMGINVRATRITAFAVAAFITSVAVSLSGLIGFVGLIVPHGVRLVMGPDHRQLIPLSALSGAMFLVIADTIGRVVVAPAELPAGVVTAIVGGPFFLVLLVRYSRRLGWAVR